MTIIFISTKKTNWLLYSFLRRCITWPVCLLFVILEKILSLVVVQEERLIYTKRLLWVKSNLWSSQLKTRQLKFIVIVIIDLCGKFSSSPVLYISRKYVSYVWTVLCLCILTSSNISEMYMTEYFEYFSNILHVVHNNSPSAPYHLTRWRNQTCHSLSVIWVEHSNVLCDWDCKSCVWIVWQYLIGFLWCYFLALNFILFGWTICLPMLFD